MNPRMTMTTRNVLGLVLVCVLLAAMTMGMPGCVNPPKDTLYVNDASGQTIGLAWDRNGDGQADQVPAVKDKIDPATGKPVIDPATGQPVKELVIGEDGRPVMVTDMVPGSGIYKPAATVDSVAPSILSGVGAFVPGGIGAVLLGLGAAWRMSRFGRIISNTVMSIQFARQRLKDGGHAEALKLLDEAIKGGQLKATIAEIAKIKEKMGLPSVTNPAPSDGEEPLDAAPAAVVAVAS